ncbi:MAG: sugar ABC transporter permease [Pirellulales bacterium]|nr:sugar ABC transporter permease [Pirellulales bacterium]
MAQFPRQSRRELGTAAWFLAPWFIGFLALVAYPFLATLWWSLCRYDLLSQPRFVGLDNYRRLWGELGPGGRFGEALWNTAYFAALSVPLSIILGVGLATLLTWNVRGRSVYRALFYLPSVVPLVAASLLWMALLDPRDGLVNHLLGSVGLGGAGWFTSPRTAAWPGDWLRGTWGFGSKDALVLMSVWGLGNFLAVYLAALADVPAELHEAAALDGAGPLRRFRHVTLPLLTPVIFFNLIMGLIHAVQAFTQVYLVSQGQGSPAGSLSLLSLHLFQSAFRELDMGYASAMAWTVLVVVVLLTALLFRGSRRWVFYSGAAR